MSQLLRAYNEVRMSPFAAIGTWRQYLLDLRISVLRAFLGRLPRAVFMLGRPVLSSRTDPSSRPDPFYLPDLALLSNHSILPVFAVMPDRPPVHPSVHPSYPSPPPPHTEPKLRHSSLLTPLDSSEASEEIGERLLHC